MVVHRLTTRDPHHPITRDHLPQSTKILLLLRHRVPMTTPSVPASPLADAAAVLITEDIMDITVDHTATNVVAAGVDAVVEAGVVAADAAVANVALTPGPPAATST